MEKKEIFNRFKIFLKNPNYAIERFNEIDQEAGQFREIFVEQPYYWLYKKIKPNTTVIDIGANIGDTAIYFAMNNNVKEVIAIEPLPANYDHLIKLIEKSPLKNKIKCIKGAVTSKKIEKLIDSRITSTSKNFERLKFNTGEKIDSYTLNEILFGLKNVVIKSDCEGAEKSIFNNIKLNEVYAMQIEYHNCKNLLKNILEKYGYEIKVSENKSNIYKEIGYIYAKYR